jgi:hypothetical protein
MRAIERRLRAVGAGRRPGSRGGHLETNGATTTTMDGKPIEARNVQPVPPPGSYRIHVVIVDSLNGRSV